MTKFGCFYGPLFLDNPKVVDSLGSESCRTHRLRVQCTLCLGKKDRASSFVVTDELTKEVKAGFGPATCGPGWGLVCGCAKWGSIFILLMFLPACTTQGGGGSFKDRIPIGGWLL